MSEQDLQAELNRIEALARKQRGESEKSNLWKPGVSKTSDMSILAYQADLYSDGIELENPHIPVDVETLEQAQSVIGKRDSEPAWNSYE
jgi:hypothetical protein